MRLLQRPSGKFNCNARSFFLLFPNRGKVFFYQALFMNVANLQKLDRWFGVPLCWFLTLARKLAGSPLPPGLASVRNILFVKLAEQGSTVLAYPALRAAVEKVGRQNVYCLVFSDNRFILDALEIIPEENVITISFTDFFSLTRSALQALGRLRKIKLDAAIDMEFFSRGSATIIFLSGAKNRVGFHTFYGEGPYRGDLMTHRLLYNPYLHTSQTFQTMVAALSCDPALLPTFNLPPPPLDARLPQFSMRPGEREEVEDILHASTGRTQLPPLILLNPNASDLLPLRRWPDARYVELASRLLVKYPELFVGFTGALNEQQPSERLAREVALSRCVSLAGKTTLRQLMVLYNIAEVLVTNDSGPAHFASLTPIRVVVLFGPETPALYAARPSQSVPLWAGIVCSPCINAYNNRQSPCRNNLCMQAITVEQVFGETCRAYDTRRKILARNQDSS